MNDKNIAGLRWFVWEWESLWEPMIEATLIAFGSRQHQIRIYSDILGQKAWLQYFILSPGAYASHICHDALFLCQLLFFDRSLYLSIFSFFLCHFSSLSGCTRLVPSVLGGGEHKDLVSLKGSLSCKHLLAEILIDRYWKAVMDELHDMK